MAKKTRKLEKQYLVRVTTHKHLKGKEYELKDRPKPRKLHNKKLGTYTTKYFLGNAVRTSKVKYFKSRAEVREYLEKEVNRFKKSKENDISAVTQVYQGKIRNRHKATIQKQRGAKISKGSRLFSIHKDTKKADIKNKLVEHDSGLKTIESQELYLVSKLYKGKKTKKRKGRKKRK